MLTFTIIYKEITDFHELVCILVGESLIASKTFRYSDKKQRQKWAAGVINKFLSLDV